MSSINVNTIKSRLGGPPTLPSGIVVSAAATFSNDVSIGGTLTYEDVTSVDVVGLITARGGIKIGAAGIGGTIAANGDTTLAGVVTATGGFSGDGSGLTGLIGAGVTNNVNTINLNVISGVSTFNNNVTLAAGNLDVDAGQLLVGSNVLIGPAGVATFSGTSDVHLKDNVRLNIGDGSDLTIYHDTSKSYLVNGTGNLEIQNGSNSIDLKANGFTVKNGADNEIMLTATADGAVDLYHNNVKTGFTDVDTWKVYGRNANSGMLEISSNQGGNNSDRFRLHKTSASSTLSIQNYASGSWESNIKAVGDAQVELYYDNSKKLSTIGYGVTVSGGACISGLTTTFGGLTVAGTMVESMSSTTTAYNTSGDLNITNGNFHFNSANLGGTGTTLNIMSTAGINSTTKVNQVLNVTAVTAVNATTAFVNKVTIDGKATGITTHWVGGSVPSDGGGSGVDTYSFNILKTGSETYIIVANQVKTSS